MAPPESSKLQGERRNHEIVFPKSTDVSALAASRIVQTVLVKNDAIAAVLKPRAPISEISALKNISPAAVYKIDGKEVEKDDGSNAAPPRIPQDSPNTEDASPQIE